MDLRPELVAWTAGFAVFVAVVGAAAVGPPDPVSQLLYAGALVVVAAPAVYRVLRVQGHGVDQPAGGGLALFGYLVAATLGSVLAATAAGALATRAARFLAFAGAFLSVSWLAVRAAGSGRGE